MLGNATETRCRRALRISTSLAMLALPCASWAEGPKVTNAMVAEFKSFCVSYYSPTQCDNALRFVAKTYGGEYFVQLRNEEAPENFLEMLGAAVKGGEALSASEIASSGTGK